MAIRADLHGVDVRHWLAAALLLACAPALAGAQDHAQRGERARGVTNTAVVDAVSPTMTNLPGRQRRSLYKPQCRFMVELNSVTLEPSASHVRNPRAGSRERDQRRQDDVGAMM
jgi:hypothetical protein